MLKHPSARRRLRLRRELEVLRGAVEAARILGEAVATSQLGPELDHRQAPRALTSLLSLVGTRLSDLRRAVRRRRPPLRLRAPAAAAPPLRTRGAAAPPPLSPSAAAPPRLSPDERVLALCALRQRAAGAAPRA
jgi:hypothetical protein